MSRGDDQTAETVYCMAGSDFEFPANSEIPIALVRRAAQEFLASGGAGRPA